MYSKRPFKRLTPLLFLLLLLLYELPAQASEAHFDELYRLLKELKPMEPNRKPPKQTRPVKNKKKEALQQKKRAYSVKAKEKIDLHSLIKTAARDAGIPASLLALVIDMESAGNPCAVSKAGAKGLCQLMPTTWKALGVKDPFDPVQNVRAGAKLLRQLLDATGGRLLETASSYNAGPRTLKKAWEEFPQETRSYLKIMVSKYPLYARGGWKSRLPRYIPRASKYFCSQ